MKSLSGKNRQQQQISMCISEMESLCLHAMLPPTGFMRRSSISFCIKPETLMRLTNHQSQNTNLLCASAPLRWILLLLFSGIAIAQETTPLPTEAANAEKGRQIVQKAITALG